MTSYSTQICFGCKKALNEGGIRIHRPGSLVYTHSLLKYEEVMRYKWNIAMTMDVTDLDFKSNINSVSGMTPSNVAKLCGEFSKYANAS